MVTESADGAFARTLKRTSELVEAEGLSRDPTPHDRKGESATFMHRAFRVSIKGFKNSGKFSDRTRAIFTIAINIRLTHRMRIGSGGEDDLITLVNDAERVIGALMGDSEMNALGLVNITQSETKVTVDGEHAETNILAWAMVEVSWTLDS